MARTKTFSPDETLAKAAEVFTRHGYEGASVSVLTQALGIGRQSLYDTYGDKRELLCAAVESAVQGFAPGRWLTNTEVSGAVALRHFFEGVVADCADARHPGCLVSNLLLEKGQSDAHIRKTAVSYWKKTHETIRKTVERGQADGSISRKHSAEEIAWALMNLLNGLRITARVDAHRARLERIVEMTLNSTL